LAVSVALVQQNEDRVLCPVPESRSLSDHTRTFTIRRLASSRVLRSATANDTSPL
jgi:hypothetical protein